MRPPHQISKGKGLRMVPYVRILSQGGLGNMNETEM